MTEPEERGSRDTGSDVPSGGPADRPSGTYKGDESVPAHDEGEKLDFEAGFTTDKPRDVDPAIPPYEGRKTSAESGDTTEKAGARIGGATAPTTDAAPKGDTAGGATASPAQEQPASQASQTDRSDDRVDAPAHTPGTGRAEDKR
jgi:hypothetical protein